MVYKHMCRQNTYTHEIQTLFKKEGSGHLGTTVILHEPREKKYTFMEPEKGRGEGERSRLVWKPKEKTTEMKDTGHREKSF